MYTSYEYVIVHKIEISELNRFGQKWKTQVLFFKIPEKNRTTVYTVQITNKIDMSQYKKGDRLKLNFDFFVCGRGDFPKPRFCVNGVLAIDK